MIAGAGPAGLAVAACLGRHGLKTRILERGSAPGWAWAGHYPSLRLHTSRAISSLPGLEIRSATAYPDRKEFERYCADYARTFALDIELDREVASLSRERELWRVGTSRGDYLARHVVLATGFFSRWKSEQWPGMETFTGRWLSPESLDDGEPLSGKRVLVVGLGNTGADMIAELRRRGAQVSISARGPIYVIPRELMGVNSFRWTQWLPERTSAAARRLGAGASALEATIASRLWARVQEHSYSDLRNYGLRLKSHAEIMLDQKQGLPPVIGGEWVELIRKGETTVLSGVNHFTADGVVDNDGRRERFDAVLPATGMEESRFGLAGELPSPLRDGEVPGKPGLWLCGTAPSLRHIGRSAPRIAAAIASTTRR